MPRTEEAGPFRLRVPGTLIQSPAGAIRWVAYHGGALTVPDAEVLSTYCRTLGEAERVSAMEFRYYESNALLPPASAPCPPERSRQAADPPMAPRLKTPGRPPPAPVVPASPASACPRTGQTAGNTGGVAIHPIAIECFVRDSLMRNIRLRFAVDSTAASSGVPELPSLGDTVDPH